MGKQFFHLPSFIRHLISFVVLCCLFPGVVYAEQGWVHTEEGWQSGRIKINSQIQIESQYSDNIYRNDNDQEDDLVTSVLPQIALTYAFTPDNTFFAEYEGDFRDYRNFDNFDKAHNHGRLLWQWLQPMGSKFEVGSNLDDSSYQPYSDEEQARDYLQWELYGDTLFKIGSATETGLKLETRSREMDDNLWAIDDYNRYGLTYNFAYRKWPFTSLIFEYSYFQQDNNDFNLISTDMDVNTVMVGPRWETGRRLTGQLLGGYSTISGDSFSDDSGFSIIADLDYNYSDVTRFKLDAYRLFDASTRSARETNIYNIATGGTFTTAYSRWDPLRFLLAFSYENQEFKGLDIVEEKRTDDFYRVSMTAQYAIRKWLSLKLQYQYRDRNSNLKSVEYEENRGTIGLIFSL